MNTTLTLMQVALVLGMSMQDTTRLVRRGMLKIHHVTNKVKHFDAQQVLAYINTHKE